jgi:hypothetical protein
LPRLVPLSAAMASFSRSRSAFRFAMICSMSKDLVPSRFV